MDASFQLGNHSPNIANNSPSASQFKQGPENSQSSIGSVHSQTKVKKREHGEQSFDHPMKRERYLRSEDADPGMNKPESSFKSDITKMKDRGGLIDSESVEKLVQLMQVDKVDKKIDLASCSILTGVIAATDKFECLSHFIQLKGLSVFDEWLQDVHKGKIGEISSLKDGDKSVEDFLLVLLRALDKLPVNLLALQTCNIGRSVNHLRSHKNLEIQKKARSLVDTWKKRVEAEMNANDGKLGSSQASSWSTKSRPTEAQGGKSSGGSCDIASKGAAMQVPTSKPMSAKVSQVEPAIRSASPSPGPSKSASSPASVKEENSRISAGSVSEEKSSISSLSVKDDAKSFPVASVSIGKISSGSRFRKSMNGFPGSSLASGDQKETGSSRNSSTQRNTAQEKSESVSAVDKALEVPPVEGSTHKLIVKIPKRGRSPNQSTSGGSFEEPVNSSRASSPLLSDKHESSERNTKENGDVCRMNLLSDASSESWQNTDFKDLQNGNDERDGSPATFCGEELNRIVEDSRKVPEVSKAASLLPSGNLSFGKLQDASFSPMKALIESCVKYSEANPSVSLTDNGGMNLLATVAAGEICKSDLLVSSEALHSDIPPVEESSIDDDVNLKPTAGESTAQNSAQLNSVDGDSEEHGTATGTLSKDGSNSSKQLSAQSLGNREAPRLSGENLPTTADCPTGTSGRIDDNRVSKSIISSAKVAKNKDGDPIKPPDDMDTDAMLKKGSEEMNKVDIPVRIASSSSEKKEEHEGMSNGVLGEKKPAGLTETDVRPETGYAKESVPGIVREQVGAHHGGNSANHSELETVALETSNVVTFEDQKALGLCSESIVQTSDRFMTNAVKGEAADAHSLVSSAQKEPPSKDVIRDMDLRESTKPDGETDGRMDWGSTEAETNSLRVAYEPDMDSKTSFDLNEGLIGDDGKYGESFNSVNHGCPPVRVINPVCTSSKVVSSCISAAITVTATAKGGFVPPVDLLRSKGELGWKGSAATSAFRPAEPRKVLQLPFSSFYNSTADESTSKQGRAALDIDLNVPDERVLEDEGCQDFDVQICAASSRFNCNNQLQSELLGPMTGQCSGGLDLDLNRVDDTNDMLQCSMNSIPRSEAASAVSFKPSTSRSLANCGIRNDFDLNGPSFEDATDLPSTHGGASIPSLYTQPAMPGFRSSNLEAGNISAWFSAGTSPSSISIPSSLPDRAEQPFPIIPPGAPQRTLGPTGDNPFMANVFRGSVLTSPALPFTANPFTYQMVPFGTTLPLASTTFSFGSSSFVDATTGGRIYTPPVNTQFLGPVTAVPSQYPGSCIVSLSDSSNNGGEENNRKGSRQGLDLNTRPGVSNNIEGREETLVQRRLALGSSQALAEEPVRMFPLAGGILKRKDPEGVWDGENRRYKQSSWQ